MNKPSVDLWEYVANFDLTEQLKPDNPLLIDTTTLRGDFSHDRILRTLGMDAETKTLHAHNQRGQYLLFGGHRGSGKSTELRVLAEEIEGCDGFLVIFIDAEKLLDINNMNYSDIALVQAQALVEVLDQHNLKVPDIYINQLLKWFDARVAKFAQATSMAAEVKTGMKVDTGLPLIGKLFATLTTAIKSSVSYKEEIRREIKDSFSVFAAIFNQLLDYARDQVKQNRIAQSIVFIVDSTDRLSRDDADNFFLRDIHQLRQISANFIYCAPIQILQESGQINQNFDDVFRMPMIKLTEKGSAEKNTFAWQSLTDLVGRRLPLEAFDSLDTVQKLIAASGGHLRDLLRLVKMCLQETDSAPITMTIANRAIQRLAKDYSRLIKQTDYELLFAIDQADQAETPINDDTRRLLYDLVLLEYNNYWWQSHPVVRTLPVYQSLIDNHSSGTTP